MPHIHRPVHPTIRKRPPGLSRFFLVLLSSFIFGGLVIGCGGNPYLKASLDPAEFEGKSQTWFLEQWGKPSGKSKRFFGGETWTYYRIAGGETGPPFWNFSPNECQITLDFDEQQKLEDYSLSGC